MTANEYSEYVLNHIGSASLTNALKITNRFTATDGTAYDVDEFLDGIEKGLSKRTDTLNPKIMCGVENAVCELRVYINAKTEDDKPVQYNRQMLLDDFIIKIWEAFRR